MVAVDSMTLVWAWREEGPKQQIQKAKWLFQRLEDDSAQVILPSIALSEYLTPMPPRQHRDVIAALSSRFIIAPFDVRCAGLSAQLFAEGKDLRTMSRKGVRKCLRADCHIVATAIVHGARVLYSDDKDCRNLASKDPRITALRIPDIPPDLFALTEDEP